MARIDDPEARFRDGVMQHVEFRDPGIFDWPYCVPVRQAISDSGHRDRERFITTVATQSIRPMLRWCRIHDLLGALVCSVNALNEAFLDAYRRREEGRLLRVLHRLSQEWEQERHYRAMAQSAREGLAADLHRRLGGTFTNGSISTGSIQRWPDLDMPGGPAYRMGLATQPQPPRLFTSDHLDDAMMEVALHSAETTARMEMDYLTPLEEDRPQATIGIVNELRSAGAQWPQGLRERWAREISREIDRAGIFRATFNRVARSEDHQAIERSRELLLSQLDDEQRAEFLRSGRFVVAAGPGSRCPLGTRFVIDTTVETFNVRLVGGHVRYCLTVPGVAKYDAAVAQKLMLEVDPDAFFKEANSNLPGDPWVTPAARRRAFDPYLREWRAMPW